MNEIQLFKNDQFGEIRTVIINGDLWFVAKDICDRLDISNVSDALSRLSARQKLTSVLTISGQNREVNVISESGMYKLAFTSRKQDAEVFTDWVTSEVLPSIRKTGSYSVKSAPSDKIEELKLSQIAWIGLGVNDNSKLLLTHKFFNHYNITTVALPDYTESKDILKALSTLLKENNVGVSAVKFNKMLQSAGVIEQLKRPSSKGGEKLFWSIKDKSFGENQVSPANPRETQPLFYAGKFADLLKAVNQPSLF